MSDISTSYLDSQGRAERLRVAVIAELAELLSRNDIALGVPIESRVKSLESIEEKIRRKQLALGSVRDLQDLIGIRLILLFKSDVSTALGLLNSHLNVISAEDASVRLGESEFGYQSQHVVCKIPAAWLEVPTLAALGDLHIEVQVRTLAQHIWAAASHKLQYKNEAGVPPPLRRTINRVSALLETVDLEFDRVLEERNRYKAEEIHSASAMDPLNVETLALILSSEFPPQNLEPDEGYADLLIDLQELKIRTPQDLRRLIHKHKAAVLKEERETVAQHANGAPPDAAVHSRFGQGVYFAHVGLARNALRFEFGDDPIDEITARRASVD